MIDFGKAKVLKGEVAETLEGLADGCSALADVLEERFNAKAIHQQPALMTPIKMLAGWVCAVIGLPDGVISRAPGDCCI